MSGYKFIQAEGYARQVVPCVPGEKSSKEADRVRLAPCHKCRKIIGELPFFEVTSSDRTLKMKFHEECAKDY